MKKASEIFTLEMDLDDISKMSYDEAFDTMLKVPGVGPKVADCILLYGFNFRQAFPTDVWIKRIVSYLYFDGKDINVSKIREFGMEEFGDYAGYVQLYLFHYARMSGLMKNLKECDIMKIKYVTIIVDDMDKSAEFYTKVLGFEVEEVFDLPGGKIVLLGNGNETGFELIQNSTFKTGFYSVGLDVEDIHEELENFRKNNVEIAMEATRISVGMMARVIDPNGVNIVLIQHDEKNS